VNKPLHALDYLRNKIVPRPDDRGRNVEISGRELVARAALEFEPEHLKHTPARCQRGAVDQVRLDRNRPCPVSVMNGKGMYAAAAPIVSAAMHASSRS
jgi:hypothetical protein